MASDFGDADYGSKINGVTVPITEKTVIVGLPAADSGEGGGEGGGDTEDPTAHTVEITVKDGETPVEGAVVTVTQAAARTTGMTQTTNAQGIATFQLAEGSYTYTVSKNGYITQEAATLSVDSAGAATGNEAALTAADTNRTVTLTIKDGEGQPAEGVTVTLTAEDGTEVGSGTTDSDGNVTIEGVPEGATYTYTAEKAGLETTTGTVEVAEVVGSDENPAVTVPEVTMPTDTSTPSTDPKYVVKGNYDASTTTYTVEAYVANIHAMGGTFGLDYDESIMTLTNIAYNTSAITIDEDGGNIPQDDRTEGYHTFGWRNQDGVDSTNDNQVLLVTYTFTMTEDDYNNWVHNETLTVMPWTETTVGAVGDAAINSAIWEESTDAAAIGGGYYLGLDKDNNPQRFIYEFDYTYDDRYLLTFKVYINDTGKTPINGAVITLTKDTSDGSEAANYTLTTPDDNTGIIAQTVAGGTYTYRVTATNFMEYPLDNAGVPQYITLEVAESQEIEIPMDPATKYNVTATATNGQFTIGTETGATLNLTEVAAKGIDFYFVVLPDAGYKVDDANPAPTYSITPEDGSDTITGTAALDPATNKYIIPGDSVVGDITLTAAFIADTYNVTVNAGTGGTVTYGAATVTPGTPYVSADITPGGSSEQITVAATDNDTDGHYVIDQIIINGEVYPIEANTKTFDYTFTNITKDQTFSVTFALDDDNDPTTPPVVQEYTVTVIVGENGQNTINAGTAAAETLTNTQKDYILKTTETLTAAIKADTNYKIDKVYKNDVAETVDDPTQTHTVVIAYDKDIVAPARHNVTSTFKHVDSGEDVSFQYWIRTQITGLGSVIPSGGGLYYPTEKPSFTFNPEAAWQIESVELRNDADTAAANVDITANLTYPDTDKYSATYTFETLTHDTTILVVYSEITRQYEFTVNFDQAASVTGQVITQTNPTVTFTRVINGVEEPIDAVIVPVSTFAVTRPDNASKSANFTVDLPAGNYTITAAKAGHLKYEITAFEVAMSDSKTANETVATGQPIEAITLTPGQTDPVDGTDNYINFFDVLRVSDGIGTYNQRADIDEDGDVDVDDMDYAKFYYGTTGTNETYEYHDGGHMATP